MSTLNVNAIKDANGANLASLNGVTVTADNYIGMRNRIINGDCRIDQRNAGASVTPTSDSTYTLDRWNIRLTQASKVSVQQNAGSVASLATTGFNNYLGVTSTSSFSASSTDIFTLAQHIEGNNVQDLQWGTASAKTITISFWVYSSKTGTFGGSLFNNAANRSYPFTFTISAANTWEYETVTIPGDTSGSWTQTTGVGIYLNFDLGSGTSRVGTAGAWAGATYWGASGCQSIIATSGATFYITGVQLEVGSVATPFERRPFELALCQRYYYKIVSSGASDRMGVGYNTSTTQALIYVQFAVSCRTSPTALEQSGTAADYTVSHTNTSTASSSVPVFNTANINGSSVVLTVASGLTAGQGSMVRAANTSAYLAWSAEL